jgi:hypothetical protein
MRHFFVSGFRHLMERRFTLDVPLQISNQRPVWLSVPDLMPKPENLVYRDDD